MTVEISPGPPATPEGRRRAEELQRLRQGELDAVRAQADRWRSGLAGLVGIVTVVAAVWGPAGVSGLGRTGRILVGVLLLLSVLSSGLGTFLSMRAAYGFPRRRQAEATWTEMLAREQTRLRRSCADLRRTVLLAYLALAFVVAAVGITWYG